MTTLVHMAWLSLQAMSRQVCGMTSTGTPTANDKTVQWLGERCGGCEMGQGFDRTGRRHSGEEGGFMGCSRWLLLPALPGATSLDLTIPAQLGRRGCRGIVTSVCLGTIGPILSMWCADGLWCPQHTTLAIIAAASPWIHVWRASWGLGVP